MGYHGSIPPFGYRAGDLDENDRRPLEPDPVNFPALALVAEWRIAGWPAKDIAAELNRHGYQAPPVAQGQRLKGITSTTPQSLGERPISERLVHHITTNRFYVQFRPETDHGITRTKREGIEHEDRHVAAWTQATWEQMHAATERLHRRPNGQPNRHYQYPFGGVVFCRECGLVMFCQPAKSKYGEIRRYYSCRRIHEQRIHSSPLALKSQVIEDAFGAILACLEGTNWHQDLEALLAKQAKEEPVDTYAERRSAIEAAIRRENLKLDSGGIIEEEYRKSVTRLRQQLRALPAQRQKTEHAEQMQAAEHVATIARCWEAAPLAEKHEMVTLLLNSPGAIFDRQQKIFVAVQPHSDFILAFQTALSWERQQQWLCRPGYQLEAHL